MLRIPLIICLAVRRITGVWSPPDDSGGTEGITRVGHHTQHHHGGPGLHGLGRAAGQHRHWRQAPASPAIQCKPAAIQHH